MKRKREDEELQHEVEQKKSVYNHGDGVAWFRGGMLGKGSFGSVFMATSKKPRSRYAYLPPVFAVKSAEVSVSGSIQKEREAFLKIQTCPCIIKCFGEEITTGENGEMVYNLLLEYGSGGTLAGLIKESGGIGLPESDVRRYTRSVLQGLKLIHECGFVHCDIKPENILLVPIARDGNGITKFKAKIADFGLAKRAKQDKRKLDPYLRGTAMYLSPEAVVDNIQMPPSDIWALGCVVLEMLTGKPVWDTKQDLDAEDLLGLIGEECKLPTIPSQISKEGKEFLKGCFVRKAMYRLTAEMLLNQPFADDDGEVEGDEVLNADGVGSSSLIWSETDDEFGSSSFSDDWGFMSEEELSYYSFSEEDAEEMDDEVVSSFAEEETLVVQDSRDITGSSIAPQLQDVIETPTQVSSNKLQQYPLTFTIPAGV
uniref:Protein kinase domain-containing protein n=1 Tax=Davidia involucrata TaxID=16924 RepID=A0A5B6YLI1_DAVIN